MSAQITRSSRYDPARCRISAAAFLSHLLPSVPTKLAAEDWARNLRLSADMSTRTRVVSGGRDGAEFVIAIGEATLLELLLLAREMVD